ncbi:MAG: c-type cytochrome [Nevskiaceae bacterium]|jgi:putative heme-binding domain-containing protein|nr:c-type cytochrome [Nevskiaceae bacterium]
MRTKTFTAALILGALCALFHHTPLHAQHETASDLLDGETAFKASCANCHGPDGDQIQGIDIGRGRLRRPMTDAELVQTILTGIPNTPMPATQMSPAQASQVVAYLRARWASISATTLVGDAARGKTLFDTKGDCASCHRVQGAGSGLGPDLTTIGAARTAAELQRALTDPNAQVQPQDRYYRVTLNDGTQVEGRLLSHDTFSVHLLDSNQRLRAFSKADLREAAFITSPMPSYATTLTAQELTDLVSYLSSLRTR